MLVAITVEICIFSRNIYMAIGTLIKGVYISLARSEFTYFKPIRWIR